VRADRRLDGVEHPGMAGETPDEFEVEVPVDQLDLGTIPPLAGLEPVELFPVVPHLALGEDGEGSDESLGLPLPGERGRRDGHRRRLYHGGRAAAPTSGPAVRPITSAFRPLAPTRRSVPAASPRPARRP